MNDVPSTAGIQSAIETIRGLREGRTLVELSAQLHAACAHVKDVGRPAEVVLKIKIKPYTAKGTKLVEQPMILEADVSSKLTPPDKEGTVFWLDPHGNPTRTPGRRERELDLNIASREEVAE